MESSEPRPVQGLRQSPSGDQKRVLISTVYLDGGVQTMAGQVYALLKKRGFHVEFAYYMPYSYAPELSVPSWQLFSKSPGRKQTSAFDDALVHEVGVRLPEFEWARYTNGAAWKELIEDFDYHIAVSGSIHAALPALLEERPVLAWVATPYSADRSDRVARMPLLRRILEACIDGPVCRQLERYALRRAKVLALSEYTRAELLKMVPSADIGLMPMAVDTGAFPPKAHFTPGKRIKIGFVGRIADPRKNIELLYEALRLCKKEIDIEALVVGSELPELEARAARDGLAEDFTVLAHISRDKLTDIYRDLDVFVIPSHQEGLAIVGLEAMASACPIVSTRCGGPEEYVVDGVNGYLCDFTASDMAEKILQVVAEEERYRAMCEASVACVQRAYSEASVERVFWQAFEEKFGIETRVIV